jgi:NTP pyrophosphatase (non-canonical NTP hydrolase)
MSENGLRLLQEQVDEWINKTGVRYFNELTNTAILMEEVGEVARIMARKFGEQSFKAGENAEKLSEELADVLFVLVCLANQTGVDLERAMEEAFNKRNSRDDERHKNNPKLQGKRI